MRTDRCQLPYAQIRRCNALNVLNLVLRGILAPSARMHAEPLFAPACWVSAGEATASPNVVRQSPVNCWIAGSLPGLIVGWSPGFYMRSTLTYSSLTHGTEDATQRVACAPHAQLGVAVYPVCSIALREQDTAIRWEFHSRAAFIPRQLIIASVVERTGTA
jgi:hypothetical protein